MPRIIDLDVIGPSNVTVRKDGIDYELPGDPPVDVWLSIIDAHDKLNGSDMDTVRELHDRMLALFRIHNPDLDALPFGVPGMFTIVASFYGTQLDDDDARDAETDPPGADEAASTTKTSSGSASSAARKRKTPTSRSRSSRSSAR